MLTLPSLLLGLAHASPAPGPLPPPPALAPAGPDTDAEAAALAALRAELEAARRAASADAAALALLDDALLALDPAESPAVRGAALERAIAADPARAPALLRAVLDGPEPTVHVAALRLLPLLPGAAPAALAAAVARSVRHSAAVRQEAITALEALQRPSAADVLGALRDDSDATRAVRVAASEALARAYPGHAAARAPLSSPLGAAGFVGAGALGGGTLFSAVGVWGEADLGVALGAVGGGLIGGGASALALSAHPQSAGGGLTHLSGTAWGFGLSAQVGRAIWPRANDWPPDSGEQGGRAALRVAGVSGGYIFGMMDAGRAVGPADVLEANALAGIGCWGGAALGDRVAFWSGGYAGDDARRHAAVFSLAGCGAGLAAGQLSRGAWAPRVADAGAVALFAVEGAVLGAGIEEALHADWGLQPPFPTGPGPAGLSGMVGAGAAGLGAWATHRRPVQPAELGLSAVGAAYGHVLAVSIPVVVDPDLPPRFALLGSAVGGVLGAAGGFGAAQILAPSGADWLGVGLVTAFTGVEAAALTAELRDAGVRGAGPRVEAVGGLAGGLAGVGVLASSQASELPAQDVLLLTSAWGWGNALGATAPVVWDGDISLGRSVGALSATALGGLLVSPWIGLDPVRTVRPQLGGVAGGTTGALVSTLFTDTPAVIAGSGVGGSVVGLGAGAVWEAVRGAPSGGRTAREPGGVERRPRPEGGPRWSGSLAPVGPAGAPGLSGSVQCVGW